MLTDRDKAKMAETMPVYDPTRKCPKCRGAEVSSFYKEGHNCGDATCSMTHPEHQLRTCQRCRYQWIEAIQVLPTEEDLRSLRLKACVARVPEAEEDLYDPRCCRFPKRCSPHGHIEAVRAGSLTFDDLEPRS